ncbi:MAG: 16S rRNA (adenine(1518)-N(6)/adenine(1519)-N(6))-dimethyltransferase RsmA [Anaerolineales bacterium]|jgi:16S rRNA (adenine1518-N6/adenine1519-N6)-dimethyltransferase
MNQMPDRSITSLFQRYNLRPDKSLGQNFLTDPAILEKILQIAGVSEDDEVLEIGAGLGHLTAVLAKAARSVTAVEIDPRFIPVLEELQGSFPNIRLVQGDILQLDPAELIEKDGYLVVANIPYYITSRIIRNLLESGRVPREIILTIQYEVARRICDQSGKLSLLALSVHMYGHPSLEARIPAGAFLPVPKVDSALIKIDLHPQPLLPEPLRTEFFEIVKAGFTHNRKTLRNSLSKGLRWPADKAEKLLESAGIDPGRRAETILMDEWLELTRRYDKIEKD